MIVVEDFPKTLEAINKEISKVIVGQEETIKKITIALLCRGHVLLIGVPGLAKTLLAESFAQTLDLSYNRVQFTPDLMPSDITGNEILQEDRSSGRRDLIFSKGPVFTNVLLGDEINRSPPKTQSALLQAMQEKKVTVYGKTESLPDPFMVLATQNPIEQEGTYPLPEAQLDRFLFSLNIGYPEKSEEIEIIKKHTSKVTDKIRPVLQKNIIKEMQSKVLEMTVSEHVFDYTVNIVRSTRPNSENSSDMVNNFVQWGAGPRASSFLLLAAKGNAIIEGRPTPTIQDINTVLYALLNHRIILNFQAEAENITTHEIIKNLNILKK